MRIMNSSKRKFKIKIEKDFEFEVLFYLTIQIKVSK